MRYNTQLSVEGKGSVRKLWGKRVPDNGTVDICNSLRVLNCQVCVHFCQTVIKAEAIIGILASPLLWDGGRVSKMQKTTSQLQFPWKQS